MNAFVVLCYINLKIDKYNYTIVKKNKYSTNVLGGELTLF